MTTHREIDLRSLRLAAAVVRKLESGDLRAGVERAKKVNRRWRRQNPTTLHDAWAALLTRDWPEIRAALLDESERGAELRQNNPFCGILTPRERWGFFRERIPHDA